jgi:hypothetical protein
LAVGKDLKPVPLERLQAWVSNQNALLLEYLAGEKDGYVLIVPAEGKARLEKLTLDKTEARVLGVDAGPLTGWRVSRALSNEKSRGVLDQLRRADTPEAVEKVAPALAVLWEVLIPEKERQAIQAGKYKRLIVLPDGPMAKLPFETLVVEKGGNPKHLLDVGPAIEYAPSATILMNLAERRSDNSESHNAEKGPHPSPLPEGERTSDREPVLTVGDCRYGEPTQLDEKNVLAQLAPRARYGTLGGGLNPLPYSATEIRWMADVFGEKGTKVAWLKGDQATESAVRFNAPDAKFCTSPVMGWSTRSSAPATRMSVRSSAAKASGPCHAASSWPVRAEWWQATGWWTTKPPPTSSAISPASSPRQRKMARSPTTRRPSTTPSSFSATTRTRNGTIRTTGARLC